MNLFTKIVCLALCCLSLNSLYANQPPPETDSPPRHETRLLQHLLEMDNAELANLRATIERIENMPPEERALLRQRIGKLKKMDPERIDAMREKYRAIPAETRHAMRQRWMSMTPQERAEWRKKIGNMSREERSATFQEEGFLPPRKGRESPQGQQGMKPMHDRGQPPPPPSE